VFHLLFNMLSLWMFGTELERMWGSAFFARYYIVSGIGAGVTQILLGFLPGRFGDYFYAVGTVGASGAIFGVLLAYGIYFAKREVMMYFLFPVQARYMVMIIGAIALYSAMGSGGGVAHTAHLGGLATGWLYLRGRRMRLAAEIQYQFARWRINRARRRFDVHPGGRDDRPRYH
jgi:membrane associated rhomboid family serine protease